MKPGKYMDTEYKSKKGCRERLSDFLLDCIYPDSLYCICCGNIIDGSRSYSLCDHCMTHLHWTLEDPVTIKGIRLISCVEYGIYERSIIFALKYDGHKYIADTIGEIMADRIRSSELIPFLDGAFVCSTILYFG